MTALRTILGDRSATAASSSEAAWFLPDAQSSNSSCATCAHMPAHAMSCACRELFKTCNGQTKSPVGIVFLTVDVI